MAPVKLPFADTDLAPLVKRYSASTIVTMLREIARCKSPKLDWVMLCKSTVTGITNPKEYQAVWRSLAYRAELEDSFEDNEAPLDDDSDLDVELDPVPTVSAAVAESISSFVKTDLQQHEHDELMEHNAGQAGVGHQAADNAVVNKQQCAATHGESAAILSCSTSTKAAYPAAVMNQSDARKRRRLWTPEEDLALIAAVDKYGEGNWTTVLKNHYDFDRSASQLSQRWALIRKRREVQEKAGYGGSGVSLLASGYNNIERLDGPKPGTLAGPGMQKDTGRPGDKAMPFGNAPTPMKQPPSSASTVPVGKRNPGATTPSGTETTASVLETQRARALPAPGVSTSRAGVPAQRPQAHNQTSMRGGATAGASTALQTLKGAVHEGSAGGSHTHASAVWRPGQGSAVGNQMFYTSTQPVTSSVPMDSKYSASRNMTTGVSRGGSKGVHGPDPMIQAAAMAAGARIAPASTAASLLKAAQSGNVVHIGSGGLPRSKLGLSNQAGNGNAGGSSGIIHYIRTGSGGSSLATSNTSLQRTTSHHMSKNHLNRAPHPVGNSSPSPVPTVPPQAARNNSQVPSQAGKPSPTSRVPATRGSSPQQQMTAPALTPASTPASTTASTSSSTPASTSTPAPLSTSAVTPPQTSLSTPSTSVPTPACGFCTTEPIADIPGEGTT
ncbi:uncharacterized protein [Physcomitrium patens]|uniref:Uncharacterized protein n=1 Tax=Physcomitrium patens TaxID=3218 RepID=A0A7I4EC25_PHYPA|nr:mucin-19-like isoform X2 [Physcomitrium patens]|eukprot:XP_024383369.1 mucin-19-like isoform X2 [Physcomitrella patens]